MSGNKNTKSGFTLIELLVVVAIIGLLASIAAIALFQARQKSRDAKRLADMVQMNNALELYFATNKGYPSETAGIPQLDASVVSGVPKAPTPADGACDLATHSAACSAGDPGCSGVPANSYYYIPSGTSFVGSGGGTVYSDYNYYFCLGQQTGNFPPGERILTPEGIK